jgi:hypothetical protein
MGIKNLEWLAGQPIQIFDPFQIWHKKRGHFNNLALLNLVSGAKFFAKQSEK